jgi:hypothetical protein
VGINAWRLSPFYPSPGGKGLYLPLSAIVPREGEARVK